MLIQKIIGRLVLSLFLVFVVNVNSNAKCIQFCGGYCPCTSYYGVCDNECCHNSTDACLKKFIGCQTYIEEGD